MIDFRYVQKIKETRGVPEETIEKDYLIELLLGQIARNIYLKKHIVFRGGTALKKAYFSDFRYSEDLDFIAGKNENLDVFRSNFEETLKEIGKSYPFNLIQEPRFPQKGHLQLFISYDIIPVPSKTHRLSILITWNQS